MRVTAELKLTNEVPGEFRTDWAGMKHEVDILVPGDPSDQNALGMVVAALEQVFSPRIIMNSLAEKLRGRKADEPDEPDWLDMPDEPGEPIEPEGSGDDGEPETVVDFPPPSAVDFPPPAALAPKEGANPFED